MQSNIPFVTLPVDGGQTPTIIGVQNTGEALNVMVIAVHMGLTCSYQPIPAESPILPLLDSVLSEPVRHIVMVDVPAAKAREFKYKLELIS